MRISDWSSDVCSSDLAPRASTPHAAARKRAAPRRARGCHGRARSGAAKNRRSSSGSFRVTGHPEEPGGIRLRRPPAERLDGRSEEHTSELQSLMRISYAVFCLKKKKTRNRSLNKYTHLY